MSAVDPARVRRIRASLLLGALALFALLYAPQPVLPQLSADFGLSPGTVALLVSAATLGLAVAAIPLGTLSQAVSRRTLMIVALVTAEVLGLVMPWIGNFPLMVGLRFVQGAAIAGLAAIAAAYLAEETGGRQLGVTMGLYVAGTTVGGMSGRLLGGVAGDFLGWHGGMFTVAVMAAVCTAAFVVLLPAEQHHQREPLRWRPLLEGLSAALRDPVLYAPYLVAALGMGAFVAVYNVLSFRLSAPPLNVPPALAALAFLAYAAGTVTSALAGRAADRWGRGATLLGGLAAAVVGLGLMLSERLPVLLLGLVVFTGGFFAAHAVANGWVSARASSRVRGQASAIYQFAYYGGSSLGGVLGGVAYGAWGWTGMSALLASWFLLAAVGVVLASRQRPEQLPPRGGSAVACGHFSRNVGDFSRETFQTTRAGGDVVPR
ncbi:MFS transporter [Bounagaea algeriensis]